MLNCCVLTALQLVGIVLFLVGFFPIKKTTDGFAVKADIPINLLGSDEMNTPSLNFENSSVSQLVLVVIDALRLDFITDQRFNENFPYLRQVLNSKQAILFEGKADPPTVTLPRIKAITTGGIPSFIDVIFNFFTSELIQDNFLTQAKINRKMINFYGDETWIKLFPNHFERSEGTTSFFVSDYTEVDLNVTRNLDKELEQNDWDLLILHYLGLDHIGHLQGPYSSLVPSKLREMDDVIKKIHAKLKTRTKNGDGKSVVVVCGDHGMSDHGSHGGSTKEEVSVPIVFISSDSYFENHDGSSKLIPQISMAPTISMLLNLPLPKNNVGLILHRALLHFNLEQKLLSLFSNYQQIKLLLGNDGEIDSETPVSMHRDWLYSNESTIDPSKIIDAYEEVITRMSGELSSKLTNRDMYLVIVAVIILWEVPIFLCLIATQLFSVVTTRVNHRQGFLIFVSLLILHATLCAISKLNFIDNYSCLCQSQPQWLISTLILLLTLTWLTFHCIHYALKIYKQRITSLSLVQYFLVASWIIHGLSFISSSFIEEEHYIWYYLNSTFHSVYLIATLSDGKYNTQLYIIGSLLCSRILMDWNRGGDKWANLSDVKKWINREENDICLSLLLICGIAVILALKLRMLKMNDIVLWIGFISIIDLKTPHLMLFSKFVSETTMARIIYITILTRIMLLLIKSNMELIIRTFINSWLLLSCLLVRPHNIPLLAILCLQEKLINQFVTLTNQNGPTKASIYYIMAMTSFFYQGNGNNFSRIDIAAGYVGLHDYNAVVVGILLVIHTYSTLIFWLASLLLRLVQDKRNDYNAVIKSTSTIVAIHALPVCTIVTVITLMRNHLFIWSVFSPKLLYEAMHSLVINSFFIFLCSLRKLVI